MSLIDKFKSRQNIDIRERLDLSDETDSPEETPNRSAGKTGGRAFGKPTACPSCGGRGYLDHLDMIDRIQYQHCPSCEHRWELTEAQITAS